MDRLKIKFTSFFGFFGPSTKTEEEVRLVGSYRHRKTFIKRIEPEPLLKVFRPEKLKISDLAFLGIPLGCVGLAIWQIQRKKDKELLIETIAKATNAEPKELPENFDELVNMNYYPYRVRGHFLHNAEMYVGPRSCLNVTYNTTVQSSLILHLQGPQNGAGFVVITPFKLADREETILINRGWVSGKRKYPRTRSEGQITGEVELVGLYRTSEIAPWYMRAPNEHKVNNEWTIKDVSRMSAHAGTSPVLIEILSDYNIIGGPIGGQTKLEYRNEHFTYILTWFGMALGTSIHWARQIIGKVYK